MNSIKGIVVHYTANPNSTAIANRNYFESLKAGTKNLYASSQYIIGLQGEIILCVPESEVAYHAGNATYNNSYIGIECCHPTADGHFNSQTYVSLVMLCADICKRYKLEPKTKIIRHYDVTKKNCPLWYVNNPKEWDKFKLEVASGIPTSYATICESLKAKGYISDVEHWKSVLEGKQAPNLDYLRILLERVSKIK